MTNPPTSLGGSSPEPILDHINVSPTMVAVPQASTSAHIDDMTFELRPRSLADSRPLNATKYASIYLMYIHAHLVR
jgi:hypothetical protein